MQQRIRICKTRGREILSFQSRIKEVAAFMRFVVNRRDEVSFLRMVSLLPGCGTGTAAKLWNDSKPDSPETKPRSPISPTSSIHQAKGLEWKAVFLIWLVNGQFPNGRILEADVQDMLEEERRLFHVVLTRAGDELYLTYR